MSQSLPAEISSRIAELPLEILRCPISMNTLRVATADELDCLNQAIEIETLNHIDGSKVERTVTAGFYDESDSYFYRVDDGIVVLLRTMAINVNGSKNDNALRAEKSDAQQFYNEVGWQQEDEDFIDASMYEDLRPVSQDYISACHQRVNEYLPSNADYLLDVASGPVQYDEYLEYSTGKTRRICVDLSFVALQQARRKLGDRGIYILGDITNLPLKDEAVDAAISLHTIYHVPADEQASAFRELSRVTKTSGQALVVYCWKPSLPLKLVRLPASLARLPFRLAGKLARIFSKATSKRSENQTPKLYYHGHSLNWFTNQSWPFEFEIRSWRSISVPLLRSYIHSWLGGRWFLRTLFWLEQKMPKLLGRWGAYPIILLRKPKSSSHSSQNVPSATRKDAA